MSSNKVQDMINSMFDDMVVQLNASNKDVPLLNQAFAVRGFGLNAVPAGMTTKVIGSDGKPYASVMPQGAVWQVFLFGKSEDGVRSLDYTNEWRFPFTEFDKLVTFLTTGKSGAETDSDSEEE